MRYLILALLLGGCMSREAREEVRLDRLNAYVAAQDAAGDERDARFMASVRARQAAAGTLPYSGCMRCGINGQLNGSDMTETRERHMRVERARKRSSREGRRAIDETERRFARRGER